MSSSRHKYETARRRLAAITFLSNISLDGKYKECQAAQNVDKVLCSEKCNSKTEAADINNEKGIVQRNSVRGQNKGLQVSPVHRVGSDNHSVSSDSEHTSTITPVKAVNTGYRERCSSGTTDSSKEKHSSIRSKKGHIVTLSGIATDDKSSSESLNFGRFRASSTIIPENLILTKELRLVRPTKGVTFKDERLVFTPARGVPCVVFSTIPYSKTVRSSRSDHRKDGVRRRNTSGPRPLSAITDNGMDPFDLLGLEREEQGQDISYSKLLIPSRVCPMEQYKKMYDGDFIEKAKITNRHPHVIARTKLLTRHKDKKW